MASLFCDRVAFEASSVARQNFSAGFIVKASSAPTSISAIDPMNGQSQFPVTSIIHPPTPGLIIAANAEPLFIMPLAVPEYFGAMSIGMAHIGPIVISAKKNPRLRQIAATVESCTKRIGNNEPSVARLQTTTMRLRALVRLPVRASNQSVV